MAAVAVVAIDALYVGLVRSQGGPPPDNALVTPFVASYFALIALALAMSLLTPVSVGVGLRGGAAGGLLVMAILTGFSIGVAVLIPALIAIAAAVVTVGGHPRRRSVISAGVGIFVAVAVLAIGLQIAWSYIACPATGQSGGTTASFFGQGASYECDNGVLTVSR